MRRKKKSLFRKYKVQLILILILAFLIGYYYLPPYLFTISTIPELSTLGFEEVAISVGIEGGSGVVRLASECHEITVGVDIGQAISIERGINKMVGFRPNTHDLMNDLLSLYKIKVLMVKITELKNNTYFGKLVLQQGNKLISLDSRPSDALALAARTDYLVPVYVNKNILESVGRKTC
jgi:bifunctional DNase/RNase